MIIENKRLIILGEVFVLILSLLIIYGWLTNNSELTRISPNWPNMQFNTALCFTLLAISGLLANMGLYKLAKLSSLVVVVVTVGTSMEYALNINLNIDTFFYFSENSTEIYPGRMSPNTIICFLFLAAINLIIEREKPDENHIFVYLLYITSNLIVICISALSILAYIIKVNTMYSWGSITGMALHTSVCFFILGMIRLNMPKNITRLQKVGSYVAVFIFLVFFVSWLFFIKYQDQVINKEIRKNIEIINLGIQNNIHLKTDSVLRLDSRLAWSSGLNYNIFRNDIKGYLRDFPDLKLIYFKKKNREFIFSNSNITKSAAKRLIVSCKTDEAKDICIEGLNNSFIAVFDGDTLEKLIDIANTDDHYSLEIKSLNKTIYRDLNINKTNARYVYKFGFRLLGDDWNTYVYFTENQYEKLLPIFPNIYFMLGFIIGFIVLLLFYFADKFSSKAKILKQREQELRILSSTDPLTKTLNRGAFLELLPSVLDKANEDGTSVAILYIDIDDFKSINDTYSHAAGDIAIVEISQKLQRHLKSKDIISRLGGDEFVIALLDINSKQDVEKTLDRIIKLFRAKIEIIKGKFISQTVSIGISIYNDQNQVCADELLNQADTAMYQAKDSGKNNYCFYSNDKNS